MRRWEKKYKKIEAGWKACNPIAYMQNRLEQKDLWKHRNSLRAPAPRMPVEQARIMLDRVINDKAEARRIVRETQQNLAPIRVKDGEKPKILYILPGFTIYGGIISVLQIVNNLVLAGYDANVAVYGRVDEKVYGLFPLYFRPYFFASKEEMIAEFPDCDLIVATGWETVYISILIHKLRPFLRMAYFVQDYEPDFYVPDHPKLAAAAEQTYYFIRHQIVKTLWLKNMLLDFPGEVHMIPLGLHLDFFFDYGKPRRKQILSLARPSSGRRNFAMVKQVFEEIHRRRPEIELALYGEGYKEQEFSFPVKSYGKLDQMQNVAGALNDSTLLLDSSIFQGFGRPGLEAMACGTGAVLTQEGGITQYAKHDYNCLLIDPTNKEQIVERLLTLIDDESKRRYLVENGLATAKEYSQLVEGERTIRLLESVLHDDRPHLELS